jgi:hypothetical protein
LSTVKVVNSLIVRVDCEENLGRVFEVVGTNVLSVWLPLIVAVFVKAVTVMTPSAFAMEDPSSKLGELIAVL